MNVSGEGLALLVVLLPGFLSTSFLNQLVIRQSQDVPSRLIEALTFSLGNYAILAGIIGVVPSMRHVGTNEMVIENGRFALFAIPIALLLPLPIAFFLNKNIHMKLLQRLGVTQRTSRDSAWLDVFTEQERYITCNLKNWPARFRLAHVLLGKSGRKIDLSIRSGLGGRWGVCRPEYSRNIHC